MKYKIIRGNLSHQCAWVVKEAVHKHDWNTIAEFWDYKDAKKFRMLKNREKNENG
jgi:hypothetical protein